MSGPVKHCRSCNAPITWAATPNGKSMPLDHPGEHRVVVGADGFARVVATYTSHFATCAQADQHRQTRSAR